MKVFFGLDMAWFLIESTNIQAPLKVDLFFLKKIFASFLFVKLFKETLNKLVLAIFTTFESMKPIFFRLFMLLIAFTSFLYEATMIL